MSQYGDDDEIVGQALPEQAGDEPSTDLFQDEVADPLFGEDPEERAAVANDDESEEEGQVSPEPGSGPGAVTSGTVKPAGFQLDGVRMVQIAGGVALLGFMLFTMLAPKGKSAARESPAFAESVAPIESPPATTTVASLSPAPEQPKQAEPDYTPPPAPVAAQPPPFTLDAAPTPQPQVQSQAAAQPSLVPGAEDQREGRATARSGAAPSDRSAFTDEFRTQTGTAVDMFAPAREVPDPAAAPIVRRRTTINGVPIPENDPRLQAVISEESAAAAREESQMLRRELARMAQALERLERRMEERLDETQAALQGAQEVAAVERPAYILPPVMGAGVRSADARASAKPRYDVVGAVPGRALIVVAGEQTAAAKPYRVGDTLPGYGRIEKIEPDGTIYASEGVLKMGPKS